MLCKVYCLGAVYLTKTSAILGKALKLLLDYLRTFPCKRSSIMNFKAAIVGSGSSNTGSTRSGGSGSSTAPDGNSFSSSTTGLSDNSHQLIIHKLNGRNYLEWAQSVRLVIDGKGKLGYLNGEVKAPASIDSKYKHWRSENFLVTAWLVNSMEPVIDK
ncbi:uncharacterized protein LOC142533365 [Primulina tabacum]|uniref:uncharacterized protein LOC142533365 n=1 Tax=Primulina tabacum TaxID=48773 RepID=UPI003F5962B5